MVDLVLLEKFLLLVVPDEAKATVQQNFQDIREDPIHALMITMGRAQGLMEKDDEPQPHKFFFANGVFLGIIMAYFAVHPDDKRIFQGWLDQHARNQGENVVDFFAKKAEENGKRG